MKNLFFVILATLVVNLWTLSLTLSAQDYELPIDAAHSVISFTVGFAGGISSIDGRFDNFEGTIGYNNRSDRSSLYTNVKIDATSLNTGNKRRDEDLNSGGWFNTEEFPEISFVSSKTTKTDDGFIITGTFTMMDIAEEIDIPFQYTHEQDVVFVFGEPRIAAKGTYVLDRNKYGIPKKGFGNIVPALGTLALLKEVEIKLMIMGRGESMSGLVLGIIESDGYMAAIALYEEMESIHAGKETYDFGERTLGGISNRLSRNEKHTDALEIGKYTVKRYPESATSHYILAASLQKMGKKDAAIEEYQRSLEINPEFSRSQSALDKLKGDN